MNPDSMMTFLDFVAERHRVWERRQDGLDRPWTDDPTLATRKFTNIFRWLDPGSQFVFNLDCDDPRDLLARLILYRYTNLPETWEFVKREGGTGEYPRYKDLHQDLIDLINTKPGKRFSGAYMIIPQPGYAGDKIQMCVELARRVAGDTDLFYAGETQAERHAVLKGHYGVGDFLALQILTDWGYLQDTNREDEFVVLGPGSRRGLKALGYDSPKHEDVYEVHRVLLASPDCPTVGGYPPSVMDAQNCLCEYSKYVKGPMVNSYRAAHPGVQPPPVLPRYLTNH